MTGRPGKSIPRELRPWATEDPGQTPLDASYIFNNADLGVFKGIGGTLSSTGKFGGILEQIEVQARPMFLILSWIAAAIRFLSTPLSAQL